MNKRLSPPPAPKKGEAVTVEPGQYPVFSSVVVMGLNRALRDPEVAAKAAATINESTAPMRNTVLELLAKLEAAVAAGNFTKTYEESHEIRGLAGNAGLGATQKISNELCRYLDAFAEAGKTPDKAVVRLHTDAIARTARAVDETAALGDAVVTQLAQLVSKKLAEINDSETA